MEEFLYLKEKLSGLACAAAGVCVCVCVCIYIDSPAVDRLTGILIDDNRMVGVTNDGQKLQRAQPVCHIVHVEEKA